MKKFLVVAAIALSCGAVVMAQQTQAAPAQAAPAQAAPAQAAPAQAAPAQAAPAQAAPAQIENAGPKPSPIQKSSLDLSTPEAAVRSYVGAINRGDVERAAQCVAGTHFAGKLPDALQELQQDMRSAKIVFTIKNLRVKRSGERALAMFQAEARQPGKSRPPFENQELPLRLTSGGWKIAIPNPDAFGKSTRGRNQMFQAVAVILMRPQLLADVQAGARANALAASCRSNLQQLGLAVFQLAQDHDEVFAIKAAALQKSLLPYGIAEEIWICPQDARDAKLKGSKKPISSYSFNANLEGVSLSQVKRPAATVMFYEGRGGKLQFRHKGRAAVALVDGNVRLVNAQQAKILSWKP